MADYIFRVEEYYTGRFREKPLALSEEEVAALIHFLRAVEQEPDIYNSVLEKSCPASSAILSAAEKSSSRTIE